MSEPITFDPNFILDRPTMADVARSNNLLEIN